MRYNDLNKIDLDLTQGTAVFTTSSLIQSIRPELCYLGFMLLFFWLKLNEPKQLDPPPSSMLSASHRNHSCTSSRIPACLDHCQQRPLFLTTLELNLNSSILSTMRMQENEF